MMIAERTESRRSTRMLRFVCGVALVGAVVGAGSAIGYGASPALAASIAGHEAGVVGGVTTVDLTGTAENAGDEASLLVLNGSSDASNPQTDEIAWVGQVTLDDTGSGSASFTLVGEDLCQFTLAVNTSDGGERYVAPLGGFDACDDQGSGGGGGNDGDGDGSGDGSDNSGSGGGPGNDSAESAGNNSAGSNASDAEQSGLAVTAGSPGFWLTLLGIAGVVAGGSALAVRQRKQ